ncbi:acid-sensing ion channel 1C-like [Hydractinia symbiolongicarpus]|uniref:acid-sensing ion channel 1C-like n=1 Tax=Hydractinia symbiolongicarpus TaxID=13093 RepID=UPI00254C40FF|nr:acid-sensing ion channel 1C-like [Hydractinia symbiolongicarpus]
MKTENDNMKGEEKNKVESPHTIKENKDEINYQQLFTNFASNTTAHGFGQITLTQNVPVKLFWILSLLACHIALYFQITPLVQHYNIDYGNSTPKSYENVFLTTWDEYFTQTEFRKKYTSSIDALVLLDEDELFEHGTSLNEMVVSCQWNFKECSSGHAKGHWNRFWHWKYGACHVFNSGFSQNGTAKDILTVSSPGPDNALSLTLFINQSQYNSDVTDAAGIRFYIGDQGRLYSPYAQGHSLSPGFSYFVGLRKRNIIHVDPLKNESCKKHHKTNLRNPVTQNVLTKYSKELCKYLCLTEKQFDHCGCIEYYLPKTVSKNKTCTSESERLCTSGRKKNLTAADNKCMKKCTAPCDEIQYKTQISMKKYPNIKYKEKEYVHSKSSKDEEIEKDDDYLKVTFYYETMETEIWEDEEVYGIVNLLADIGGQLGLFSGYSVLTIIEFLFFLFYVAAHTVYFIIPGRRARQN